MKFDYCIGNPPYQAENENDVSEIEIQNILAHYKRIGNDEEKYVDKLKTLLTKPRLKKYYDVIEYLIENKVWLEQESFYNV